MRARFDRVTLIRISNKRFPESVMTNFSRAKGKFWFIGTGKRRLSPRACVNIMFWNMSDLDNLVQVLKRCFSLEEWRFLKRVPDFAEALETLQSTSDVERLVYQGRDILRERDGREVARVNAHFLG
jgi:hypothetical protein